MSTSACDVDEKMVVVVVVVEGRTEGVCFMLFHHVCHHACSILQIDLVESGPIFGSYIGAEVAHSTQASGPDCRGNGSD